MPNRLKKRCGYRGCPNTTTDRYCPEHLPLARRFTDRARGTTAERGYDADWQRLAEQRRNLDHYLCQHCLADDRLIASVIVDHIVPLHIRPDWRLEIANTQVLCSDCHTRKSSQDNCLYGGPNSAPTVKQTKHRTAAECVLLPPRHREQYEE